MYEYKTVTFKAKQGLGGSKGSIDTEGLDCVLNKVAKEGWRLFTIEALSHTSGTRTVLCVFERDRISVPIDE